MSYQNLKVTLSENSSDLISFVYQQLSELEGFMTPSTRVHITARDPEELREYMENEVQDELLIKNLNKMHRISISLNEGDAQIESEGLSENIFEAIQLAKQSLFKKLSQIQDSVVSQKDRLNQISFFKANSTLH